jgi:hypothetical protein
VFHAARGGHLRPNNVLHQFVEEVIATCATKTRSGKWSKSNSWIARTMKIVRAT